MTTPKPNAPATSPASKGSASVWQVEVIVKHHGVTLASSKEEAITNCNRDGYHGRTDTLRYLTRKKPNVRSEPQPKES